MPDSLQPPSWGPAPFDERDLDAVLSGQPGDVPAALRPVAETIAALRAAPMPAELSGETAIMAEFRAMAGSRGGRQADTLELPLVSADGSPRRSARHRARRRGARQVSRRTGALMGAAAAVLIVVAVAFAGNLPGPIQRFTPFDFGRSSTASPSAGHSSGGKAASSGVQGSATPTKPATPQASVSSGGVAPESPSPSPTSSPGSLCRAYFGYFLTHRQSGLSPAEKSLYWQLARLARSPELAKVLHYCASYLGDMYGNKPSEADANSQGPGDGSARTGPGYAPSQSGGPGPGQGNQGPQDSPSPGGSPAP
jgi:hypothetical protein